MYVYKQDEQTRGERPERKKNFQQIRLQVSEIKEFPYYYLVKSDDVPRERKTHRMISLFLPYDQLYVRNYTVVGWDIDFPQNSISFETLSVTVTVAVAGE